MTKDLILDLDGTAVVCGRIYSAACNEVADFIATSLHDNDASVPVDPGLARQLIDELDIWAIKANAQDGFRKERFPRSLAAALAAAQIIATDTVRPGDLTWAYQRGMQVFDPAQYVPFDGALDAIRAYKAAGWRVWICTKGDPSVQVPKITHNGFDEIVDGWRVVPRKNPEMLRAFCAELGIEPANAVYVGDSVRDDMGPAKSLGMRAIRIETAPEDNWVHELIEDPHSDHVIASLKDLPTVVPL